MSRKVVLGLAYSLAIISIIVAVIGLNFANLEPPSPHLARIALIISLDFAAVILILHSMNLQD